MTKEEVARQVTERLLGKVPAQIRREKQIRRRIWYRRYDGLADFLIQKPSPAEILKRIDSLLDSIHAYDYQATADLANESLKQVIRDKNLK